MEEPRLQRDGWETARCTGVQVYRTGVQDLFLKVGDLVFLILLLPTSPHVPLFFF